MNLIIFDLDETLIKVDSDVEWGRYLIDKNLVDPDEWKSKNEKFYSQYKSGQLNIDEYLAFSCEPLKNINLDVLKKHRKTFISERIKPNILKKGQRLIEKHRSEGDELLVITATIEFITKPIVALLGIEQIIAPIPEFANGAYTGKIVGIPSFRNGKLDRLNQWLKKNNKAFDNITFYSDSHNDIPLLSAVTKPVAVDPDPILLEESKKRNWLIISLR